MAPACAVGKFAHVFASVVKTLSENAGERLILISGLWSVS